MSVLIHRRRELAETQISMLAERRADIPKKLNRLQDLVSKVTRTEATPYTIEDLITKQGVEKAVVKLWLYYNFVGADLPIKDSALTTAFYYPRHVSDLIEACQSSFRCSEDLSRYWQGDKFAPLPVTDEEREGIFERAEIRVATEQDAQLYRKVEELCNLANLRNEKTALTTSPQVSLQDLTTGPNIIYAGLIKKGKPGGHPLDPDTFEVNGNGFNQVKSSYRAFDENVSVIE